MITTRIAPCEGWEQCLWISNGIAEVAATLDAGIRLVFYGFPGKENMLRVLEERERPESGEQVGGFRLQTSTKKETGLPAGPVQWEIRGDGVRLSGQPEENGLQKTLTVTFTPGSSEVTLTHGLALSADAPEDLDALTGWSVVMMEEGGLAVLPQAREEGAEDGPNRTIALWPGANLADPRILWGMDHILVQQANMRYFRMGISCEAGWAAYFNMGNLFVLRFAGQEAQEAGARYADRGCCLEVATGEQNTELITLTPRMSLKKGESVTFSESWTLYGDIPCPPMDEHTVVETLAGIL